MYHAVPRDWLMATNKIEIEFIATGCSPMLVHGSGFWVDEGGPAGLNFVTNRHIVDAAYKDKKYVGRGYQVKSLKILNFDPSGNPRHVIVRSCEILICEDDSIDLALIRDIRIQGTLGVTSIGLDIIADNEFITRDLEWGAQVSFSSFQLWRDATSERPILRTGWVSSDPQFPFEVRQVRGRDLLLLEAFSFAGSSGSPVFANARGIRVDESLTGGYFRPAKLVGVMCGHLVNRDEGFMPSLHPGLSYCHRSDLLLKVLAEDEPTRRIQTAM